jgi:hypothetical protein
MSAWVQQSLTCSRLSPEVRYTFAATMLAASLMPYVPDQISVAICLFVAAAVLLYGAGLLEHIRRGFPRADRTGLWIALFLGLLLLSYPLAQSNDVPVSIWLRAVSPFLFLSTYFVLRPVRCLQDARFVLNTLQIACLAWVVKIAFVIGPSWRNVLAGRVDRLTYLTLDLTLPYGLIGLVLAAFNPAPLARRCRPFLIPFFLLFIFGSGYRLHALIAVVVLAAYALRHRTGAIIAVLVVLPTLVLASATLWDSSFMASYVARFAALRSEGDNSRSREISFALERTLESPMVGKGPGFQVPIAYTIDSTNSRYGRLSRTRDSVGYIHNVAAYLAMTMGVLGLSLYAAIFVSAVRTRKPARTASASREIDRAALIVLFALIAFFCTSAAFRQIQSNLILAALCAVLARTRTHCTGEVVA